jgi:hypothetical protein
MLFDARNFVRAILPAALMAICHGCGGGGGGSTAAGSQTDAPPSVAVPAPAAVNRAPTITTASTAVARVGETYDYQPVATDPDGDTLRFTANNLPPWASMDPNTGRITGTPGEGDLGEYEAITIVVADASGRTESDPFSITVVADGGAVAGGTGVASLQWETPPSKVDGSPLDDLAGYRILYGRTADELDRSVLISNPTTTSYQFETLDPGTWYFAVVAVNAGGLEGPATTPAQKSI